jgi:hypothetical protein
MLTPRDLQNQHTFFKYKDGNWHTGCFDYIIIFEGNRTVFASQCEVTGEIEEIKTLTGLDDLKDTFELLTGEEFDYPEDDEFEEC